jgi:3-mercaptopropionate dioxygenase
MTQVTYGLSAFTEDLDRLVEEDLQDDAELVRRAKPLLEQLLADMSWLDERYHQPRGTGSVQYLLHQHPQDAYTITATVFAEGYHTTVHDHTAWGLIGVWRGEEREERFARLDDRSDPGRAELNWVGTVLNRPGSVTWLIPPDQEIHRITNLSPFPSLSIHVYGADLNGKPRHQYVLDTGDIKEFTTTAVVLE